MVYYRTKADVKKLVDEFKSEFTHRSEIKTFIKKKYHLPYLGIFAAMTKDSIWLGQGDIKKDDQLKTSDHVQDFIVNFEIFSDVKERNALIEIFGRLENGKLVDIIALNLDSLIDP